MLTEKTLLPLQYALKRIFALSISRSTFREVQNAVMAITEGSKQESDMIFKVLLTGEVHDGEAKGKALEILQHIVNEHSVPVRVAKDVFERGEFVSLLSSDTLHNPDRTLFVNRIRRVDGEEFLFITDPEATVHFLSHFIGRMADLDKNEQGEKTLSEMGDRLARVREMLDQLIAITAS